jgi:alpha-beta hydrolase superfamily lysophospholipase
MVLQDGTRLAYRVWEPFAPARNALIVLHRGHEHSGRLRELVQALDLDDVAVFAWDARGHGHSDGRRGHADVPTLIRDLDAFVRSIRDERMIPVERMAVMGQSLGAVVAAAWVHDYGPSVRALVLTTPAFRIRLYVPFAIPLLHALARLRPGASVRSYVTASMLTHDRAEAGRYEQDPLITRNVSADALVSARDVATRLLAGAAGITVPTLVLVAGADRVVARGPQQRFFERLGSTVKSFCVYPGFYHGLFHERERARPIATARRFLDQAFRAPRAWSAPRPGNTETFASLSRPLSPGSPRRYAYAALRVLVRTVGQLSRGVQIGVRHGFDSGVSLDYVYADTAHGVTPLGRWIDRRYLDAIGWRAIRQRKRSLDAALQDAMATLGVGGRRVRIVDIAAGPGRLVLEALSRFPQSQYSAELRDRDLGALDAGKRLADTLNVSNVTFTPADAFSERDVAAIRPRPDIAIAAGLYELVSDNERVLASLRGLRQALRSDGVLIYTNQPWHPQLELIARALTNSEGQPWVMRCRSQAEMDALIGAAGFEKRSTTVDDHGIFTVSVATVAV